MTRGYVVSNRDTLRILKALASGMFLLEARKLSAFGKKVFVHDIEVKDGLRKRLRITFLKPQVSPSKLHDFADMSLRDKSLRRGFTAHLLRNYDNPSKFEVDNWQKHC